MNVFILLVRRSYCLRCIYWIFKGYIMTKEEFDEIRENTALFFQDSEIRKEAEATKKKWYYSISATKIVKNNPMIIGLNWGAGAGEIYSPQLTMPEDNFLQLFRKNDLGSFSRIMVYLKQYFLDSEIENITMSNYCFLRSSNETQIIKDIEKWKTSKIFDKFLVYSRPSKILCFGNQIKNYFQNEFTIKEKRNKRVVFNSRNYTYEAIKGILEINNKIVPIFFFPHPNSKFQSEALQDIWEFHFK